MRASIWCIYNSIKCSYTAKLIYFRFGARSAMNLDLYARQNFSYLFCWINHEQCRTRLAPSLCCHKCSITPNTANFSSFICHSVVMKRLDNFVLLFFRYVARKCWLLKWIRRKSWSWCKIVHKVYGRWASVLFGRNRVKNTILKERSPT